MNKNHTGDVRLYFRRKRAAHLISLIDKVHRAKGKVRIIDIGGTEDYWRILPDQYFEENEIHITLLNLFSSSSSPKKNYFSYIQGDACAMPEINNLDYDIAHSNSVVEHVGDWAKMKLFANEIARIAPYYFIQTPNFWFPLEPHSMVPFYHWLPKPTRVFLLNHMNVGRWRKCASISDAVTVVESARLLSTSMMTSLFPDAQLTKERVLLLPKSLLVVRS